LSWTIKVAALQKRMGGVLSTTEFERLHAAAVDVVCLPEYFFVSADCRNQIDSLAKRQTILNQLESFSRRLAGIVVGGSLVEREGSRYFNACHLFDCGRYIGSYRKIHITDREESAGISRGDELKVFEIRGIRLGVMICADALHPEMFTDLAAHKPDLIAIPTVSPFLSGDTVQEKNRRDQEIFLAGAQSANTYIVKTCGVGAFMGKPLQGRSLICSPTEIIEKVPIRGERLETTLIGEIDLSKLRAEPATEPIADYKAVINL
jgi:omega-amidase